MVQSLQMRICRKERKQKSKSFLLEKMGIFGRSDRGVHFFGIRMGPQTKKESVVRLKLTLQYSWLEKPPVWWYLATNITAFPWLCLVYRRVPILVLTLARVHKGSSVSRCTCCHYVWHFFIGCGFVFSIHVNSNLLMNNFCLVGGGTWRIILVSKWLITMVIVFVP